MTQRKLPMVDWRVASELIGARLGDGEASGIWEATSQARAPFDSLRGKSAPRDLLRHAAG